MDSSDRKQTQESSDLLIKRAHQTAVIFVVALVAGQALVASFKIDRLWPFSPVTVYRSLPTEFSDSASRFVYYSGDQEEEIVLLPGFNYRILRIFGKAVWREDSDEWRDFVLAQLSEYLEQKYGSELQFSGIRIYHLRWDLKRGEVTDTHLFHDYRKP